MKIRLKTCELFSLLLKSTHYFRVASIIRISDQASAMSCAMFAHLAPLDDLEEVGLGGGHPFPWPPIICVHGSFNKLYQIHCAFICGLRCVANFGLVFLEKSVKFGTVAWSSIETSASCSRAQSPWICVVASGLGNQLGPGFSLGNLALMWVEPSAFHGSTYR